MESGLVRWTPSLMLTTEYGSPPMNEYRPRRSLDSTLSSRNDGLPPAIFRYAETGVSRSARISLYSGTLWP